MSNRNTFLAFQKELSAFEIVNLNLIRSYFPTLDHKRLHEWLNHGYLQRLIKGWYAFADFHPSETTWYRWSNLLRKPSYISLESAFSYYGFIPEYTFEIKAVSTHKTMQYLIMNKRLTYNTLAPGLLFGYDVVPLQAKPILIAKLEKAILDYLYLHPHVDQLEIFESLRWNTQQNINWELFDRYLAAFDNKQLDKRAKQFKLYMP